VRCVLMCVAASLTSLSLFLSLCVRVCVRFVVGGQAGARDRKCGLLRGHRDVSSSLHSVDETGVCPCVCSGSFSFVFVLFGLFYVNSRSTCLLLGLFDSGFLLLFLLLSHTTRITG
jgi:hypothetical protein